MVKTRIIKSRLSRKRMIHYLESSIEELQRLIDNDMYFQSIGLCRCFVGAHYKDWGSDVLSTMKARMYSRYYRLYGEKRYDGVYLWSPHDRQVRIDFCKDWIKEIEQNNEKK